MSRPLWVLKDLCDILGFDEDTVKEALLPDLEGYKNEVKLRSHLQDFLGPTPAAKNFTDRYVSLRFPKIASSSLSKPAPVTTGPSKPKTKPGTPSIAAPSRNSSRGVSPNVADSLNAAFGPAGKVYQKNRAADDTGIWGRSASPGSGSHSPSTSQVAGSRQPMPLRTSGAVMVQMQEGKGKSRIDHAAGGLEVRKGKEKEKEKIWDLPKSRAVGRLEGIMADLRTLQEGEGKVVKEKELPDCFCQARVHPPSKHTPHCSHCGHIMCSLHAAYHPCPSCHNPLLSPAQLARLLLRLQTDLDGQLAHEQFERDEAERDRLARLVAESGGGSFPTLGGGRPQDQTQERGRKVLTLGKGAKGKATLTTTFTRPSAPSTPPEPVTPPPTDIISRPRSPPLEPARVEKELAKVLSWRVAQDRPWGDMKGDKKGEVWKYVEMAVVESILEDVEGRRKAARRKKPGKGVGIDGKAVPGAV